ncbi:tetraacyldisaccharide 4'-kinase [Ferrimonas marina]|uniref:Tetraacyldisaccharide 4'-kinase n=1 Tax=Ferrimonas marina TaxID=299255 RepID=A0A1M5YQP9_9GAMM|nr:tetraacyldisaccharide 4'-kinase [Ferrimonas marina]SHI14437.1 lipid-A-disaccharide kinase [Ferrimonas marina]
MQAWLERAWQQGHPLLWLLAPLTALFVLISTLRRWAYRRGWLEQPELSVPLVVVGNISVGGNGKTPTVIYLVELLKRQGLRPGIISRGYGGKAEHYPLRVDSQTPAELCGDEPALMARRTGVPLAVGPDRVAAAQLLQNEVDILISDDGMQHYRLARQLELAVVDGARRFGNGWRLPMGPLREPIARLSQCDWVVCNGGQPQRGEFLMTLEPAQWRRVQDDLAASPEGDWVAMAGIGHPPRFFATLAELGTTPVACHSFADHQAYQRAELAALTQPGQSLVMTEKDAVKCRDFAQANWYYLPVTASLGADFDSQFMLKVKEVLDGV